jgi:DNA-directed RNA polymerase specialized sigma24 family protein
MADSTRGTTMRLIDLANKGDIDAKGQLWERYRKLLYAMAHDIPTEEPSGAADTSDVVAEAAVRFLAADVLEGIKDRDHFKNLLRQIVQGKKIDMIRREEARPAQPLADDSGLAPVGPVVQDFILIDLRDLLNNLPLSLHETAVAYMECGNEREAAEELKITRHEFRNRLVRIRGIWAKALGEA